MKKALFFTLLCIFTSCIWAQKIEVNKLDKFTNKQEIRISSELLYRHVDVSGISAILDTRFISSDSNIGLICDIIFHNIVKYGDGDGISLLLDDGQPPMDLISSYTGIGSKNYEVMGFGGIKRGYSFSTLFILTNEQLQRLSEYNVTDVRVRYLGGTYDSEVSKKAQKKFKKAAGLLLNTLNK